MSGPGDIRQTSMLSAVLFLTSYVFDLPKCVEGAETWYQHDVNHMAAGEPIFFSHGPRPLERLDLKGSRTLRCSCGAVSDQYYPCEIKGGPVTAVIPSQCVPPSGWPLNECRSNPAARTVQKSYKRGCQVKNTSPCRNARNIFWHPAPIMPTPLL